MKNKIIYVAACLLLLLNLTACELNSSSSSNQTTPTAQTTSTETIPNEYAGKTNPLGTDAVSAGAQVFKDYCAACHGASGHGDGPSGAYLKPRPKNLAELQTQVKDDYLFWRISEGKPGTNMASWKGVLTEEEIWQVIAFIRTLK